MSFLRTVSLISLSIIILALGGLALAQDKGDPGLEPPDNQGDYQDRSNFKRDHGDDKFRGRPHRREMNDGQKEAFEKIQADHLAKVETILDQIQDNRLLYKALVNNQNASVDEIKKTIAELSRLRKELRTESKSYQAALKEQGLPSFLNGRSFMGGPMCQWGCDVLNDRFDGDWENDDGYDDDQPNRSWRGGRRHHRW
jgi:hypothetical protein